MTPPAEALERNLRLYPAFRACKNLIFWQAVWFLYFQETLSAAEAVLLYAVYDLSATALEVPSGWMSDRLGRRRTLIASAAAGLGAAVLLATGETFWAFAAGQALLGASMAFLSGTDSAFLYETLAARGREAETEAQELKAWRWGFAALAVSALAGALMARVDPAAPFAAGAAAFAAALAVALRFAEPPRAAGAAPEGRMASMLGELRRPVLAWLFALGLMMYALSHVPFVFGQPFILEALEGTGWSGEAPAVSGAVTTGMMLVSLAVSAPAPWLRRRLGLARLLLLAFAMQAALIGAMALSGSAAAIALLLLRMAPDAWSRPFVLARMQPLLSDGNRATLLSLQSFCGRLLFAGSLWLSSLFASRAGAMTREEMTLVLGAYAAAGAVGVAALAAAALRVPVDRPAARR